MARNIHHVKWLLLRVTTCDTVPVPSAGSRGKETAFCTCGLSNGRGSGWVLRTVSKTRVIERKLFISVALMAARANVGVDLGRGMFGSKERMQIADSHAVVSVQDGRTRISIECRVLQSTIQHAVHVRTSSGAGKHVQAAGGLFSGRNAILSPERRDATRADASYRCSGSLMQPRSVPASEYCSLVTACHHPGLVR